VSDPDSIVEYVKWLDSRFNRLVDAISNHRTQKHDLALAGSIDGFDRELWAHLEWAHRDE